MHIFVYIPGLILRSLWNKGYHKKGSQLIERMNQAAGPELNEKLIEKLCYFDMDIVC